MVVCISMSIYQVHVPKLATAFTNIKIEDNVKEILLIKSVNKGLLCALYLPNICVSK